MASPLPTLHTGTFGNKLQTHAIREWIVILERSNSFITKKLREAEKKGWENPIDFVIAESERCNKFKKPKPAIASTHQKLFNNFVFKRKQE